MTIFGLPGLKRQNTESLLLRVTLPLLGRNTMTKAVHKRKHLIWLQFEQVRVHDGEAEVWQLGRAESSHAMHRQKAEEAN